MSDVAKHAGVVGHAIPFHLGSPTVFDGDDYSPVDPSFDIDGAAARVVTEYDADGDGAIDLGSGGLGDLLRQETSRFTGSGTDSIARLAKFADENGNRDGAATVEEIADVIAKFDQGNEGDARLSGQERETFLEVFGEEHRPAFRHLDPFPGPFDRLMPLHRHPKEFVIGDHPPFARLLADEAKLS
ncbi:MAG: hypothetical protein JWL76_1135 [Thermoleophilia bacterium]|nr:hypothetical protein [Thermoleophilia bacterium]